MVGVMRDYCGTVRVLWGVRSNFEVFGLYHMKKELINSERINQTLKVNFMIIKI